MRWFWWGHWIPQEAVILVATLIGFAIMFQAKKLARVLLLLTLGAILMPMLLSAGADEARRIAPMIPWYVWVVGPIVLLGAFLGRDVWVEAFGHVLADGIRFVILAPFRIVGWLFGGFSRRRGS